MVYYKLIIDSRRTRKDGLYPIFVRISFNSSNTTVTTGVRVRKEHWDQDKQSVTKLNENFQKLNQSISEVYLKIQKNIHQLVDANEFSFAALKERLDENAKPFKRKAEKSFKEYSEALIQQLLSINKTGNALVYQTASNRLQAFVGDRSLMFKELNYKLLEEFRHSLMKDGVKQNTIGNYFRTIRAIYNRAIKEKLVDRSSYPFQEITIKVERTAKRAVLINELAQIYNLDLIIGSPRWHARNYFFLSFSLIGISFTDLAYLMPANIVKGRLIYRRRKTHKQYNLKLSQTSVKILKMYEGSNEKYLLPILPTSLTEDSMDAKVRIHQWIKTTNKWLKKLAEDCEIEDTVTTYVARHTWATTAKRLGYSNELIAEAMGHEYGNKITNIYLDSFDQDVIDELNEKVILTLINTTKN